jgi:hypothetical protein
MFMMVKSDLVLVPVQVRNLSMSQDNVVGNNVGLGARAPLFAVEVAEHGASARCMNTAVVALHCHRMWLVEGNPTLYPVSKRLETRLRICGIVIAACISEIMVIWLLDQR